MSTGPSERRTRADRRRAARGGRRTHDASGFTPLVLVVGRGGTPQRESETILRELRFAVAPAADMAEAVRVLDSLHPDLVVAHRDDAPHLRPRATGVPIVEYDADAGRPDDLVDRIRDAIRARP